MYIILYAQIPFSHKTLNLKHINFNLFYFTVKQDFWFTNRAFFNTIKSKINFS